MTDDEIAGRLVVLEVFATTAFGLYLSNARNDPDFSKATALLDHTRAAVSSLAATLPPQAQSAAHEYADHLLSVLAENLRNLRG
jgi:hypothetical protein